MTRSHWWCVVACLGALTVAVCALLLVVTFRVSAVPPGDVRAIAWNLRNGSYDLARTTKTAADFTLMVSKDYYDPANPEVGFYWELWSQMQAGTVASRNTSEFLQDLSANLLGGRDSKGVLRAGTIPAATSLLGSFQAVADKTAACLDKLADPEDSPLKPVAESMRNVAQITADLEKQMATGGNVDQALAAFQSAVKRLDDLLQKPEVAAVIDNLEGATGHANGTAANMDEATGYIRDMLRPTKQSFWKQLAFKAAGAALPPIVTNLIPQQVVVTNTVKTK